MNTITQNDATQQVVEEVFEVRAIVETYQNRPERCTLYPVKVPEEEERFTTWITAKSGSFVDGQAMR